EGRGIRLIFANSSNTHCGFNSLLFIINLNLILLFIKKYVYLRAKLNKKDETNHIFCVNNCNFDDFTCNKTRIEA
ncbi:MAG: hypothetical protein Q4A15_10715, partial [Prevotellaceae bacterium]|nr:hypothetical protein [Prevotellaceae bacterium]